MLSSYVHPSLGFAATHDWASSAPKRVDRVSISVRNSGALTRPSCSSLKAAARTRMGSPFDSSRSMAKQGLRNGDEVLNEVTPAEGHAWQRCKANMRCQLATQNARLPVPQPGPTRSLSPASRFAIGFASLPTIGSGRITSSLPPLVAKRTLRVTANQLCVRHLQMQVQHTKDQGKKQCCCYQHYDAR